MFKLYGTKTCEHCGKQYNRSGAKGKAWEQRRFCGRECANQASRATVHGGKQTYDGPLKPCQICGVDIIPKPRKGAYDYHQRRTCGKVCGYKMGTMTRAAK